MEISEHYDYLFKIVVVGDAGVGKTALIEMITKGVFWEGTQSTIVCDFAYKVL